MVTLREAEILVKTARMSIAGEEYKGKFSGALKEKSGAFVTLLTYPKKELRGCIGYVEPIFPLADAVKKAAAASAYSDPRFHPVKKEEMEKIIIEISVLTKPRLIEAKSPDDYLKKIKIGRDGLIVRYRGNSGLLLPQVPVEFKWDEMTFISQTCVKAGLPPNFWIISRPEIYFFQTQIFAEEKPNSKVKEIKNKF